MARLNLTDETKVIIVDKYNSGHTLAELAVELGCSIPTVSRILKDKGVTIRSRGRQKKVVNTVEVNNVEEVTEEESVSMSNINLEGSVSVNEW